MFAAFSRFHPISFQRVLPSCAGEPLLDDPALIQAEIAHLAEPNDETRRGVVAAFANCGLLAAEDAGNLAPVTDSFDTDFFEFMGQTYANAGLFRCALRWHRECIAALESAPLNVVRGGQDEVHAGVGYCLYAMGLFPEAIAWTKSCIGPCPMIDAVCECLIEYEAQNFGGAIQAIERGAHRVRYTVSTSDLAQASQISPRLVAAMKTPAPFREVLLSWVDCDKPAPEAPAEGYPFRIDFDASELPRHKLNLLFATCGQADLLVQYGHFAEAECLLREALLLEPRADFLRERLESLLRARGQW